MKTRQRLSLGLWPRKFWKWIQKRIVVAKWKWYVSEDPKYFGYGFGQLAETGTF